MSLIIRVATASDNIFASEISELYKLSAKERGTGIATRTPEYISSKMRHGNAVIVLFDGECAGFCYVETFSNDSYVSNSGLIVKTKFRGMGLARKIKDAAVNLARDKYPKAKLFGITTSDVVMRINNELGYIPVPLYKLTSDDEFWKGCSSCRNYDILQRNNRKMCLCTGMMAPSKEELNNKKEEKEFKKWQEKEQ